MIRLTHNRYGKSRVRLVKVVRFPDRHDFFEVTVHVHLEGRFEHVYTEGDNRNVLPTDTMKNTVYALARKHTFDSIEQFGQILAKHFLDHNPDVSTVCIELIQGLWNRIPIGAKPHAHAFSSAGTEKRTAVVTLSRSALTIESGLQDLLVLKTTGSAFKDYIKDAFTTLKETDDRIFSTSMNVQWTYSNLKANFTSCYEAIRKTVLETFAERFSLSVQQTVYDMGKAALEKCPDISEIRIAAPNKHCLLVNLEPFGMTNENEIFVATDEPHGLIEGTLRREP